MFGESFADRPPRSVVIPSLDLLWSLRTRSCSNPSRLMVTTQPACQEAKPDIFYILVGLDFIGPDINLEPLRTGAQYIRHFGRVGWLRWSNHPLALTLQFLRYYGCCFLFIMSFPAGVFGTGDSELTLTFWATSSLTNSPVRNLQFCSTFTLNSHQHLHDPRFTKPQYLKNEHSGCPSDFLQKIHVSHKKHVSSLPHFAVHSRVLLFIIPIVPS